MPCGWWCLLVFVSLTPGACGGRVGGKAASMTGAGPSGSSASGSSTTSGSTGVGTTGSSAGSTSGSAAPSMSGNASDVDGGAASDTGSPSCPGPSRYIETQPTSCQRGECVCAANAFSLDGGACMCEQGLPKLCTYGSSQSPQCVEETLDPNNCGGCGVRCKIGASCNGGVCGSEPTELVPPAPGCLSMRVVYDSNNIYWSDMGHGTISSIAVGGGPVTTIASGLHIAAVQGSSYEGLLQWPDGSVSPLSTALLVRAGTVYWVGSATTAECDDGGICAGGVGTTLMSATAGNAPKTLLTMALDPSPSPVSAKDAASGGREMPGQNPPINAIAISPDGSTLYFAAGTRFYSIPSSGGGLVTYVGYSVGPESGEATALFADNSYLYYPTNLSGSVEVLPLASMCDPDAGANETCPYRIGEGQGQLVFDTVAAKGGFVYWGDATTVRQGDVAGAVAGSLGTDDFPFTAQGTDLTGFAVGTRYAYFGEPGLDSVCSQDPATPCGPMLPANTACTNQNSSSCSGLCPNARYACPDTIPANQGCVTLGYIEKGAAPPFDAAGPPPSIILARNQPTPTSFALDGTNVYWTTTRCDISYIADSPQ